MHPGLRRFRPTGTTPFDGLNHRHSASEGSPGIIVSNEKPHIHDEADIAKTFFRLASSGYRWRHPE